MAKSNPKSQIVDSLANPAAPVQAEAPLDSLANPAAPVQADAPLEEQILSAEEAQRQRVAELEAERNDLQQQLADVQQRRFALQREEFRLSQELDKRTAEIARLSSPQSTTEEIQAYIEQQKAVREARAARTRQLIEAGVSPGELRSSAAPIDKKLAARRPTDRPKAAL